MYHRADLLGSRFSCLCFNNSRCMAIALGKLYSLWDQKILTYAHCSGSMERLEVYYKPSTQSSLAMSAGRSLHNYFWLRTMSGWANIDHVHFFLFFLVRMSVSYFGKFICNQLFSFGLLGGVFFFQFKKICISCIAETSCGDIYFLVFQIFSLILFTECRHFLYMAFFYLEVEIEFCYKMVSWPEGQITSPCTDKMH